MAHKRRRPRYTSKPDSGRTAVYQFRDRQTQQHLYVGITNNPERRFQEHAGLSRDPKKEWWDQADHRHVTITWYPTRRAALAVETRLIKQHRPPGNKLSNPDWEASTTWRPRKRAPFRQAVHPAAVAAVAWGFFAAQASGVWVDVPPAVTLGSFIVAVVATRVAWKKTRA